VFPPSSSPSSSSIVFSGRADIDFFAAGVRAVRLDDAPYNDVGLPDLIKQSGYMVSGWDIQYAVFSYDNVTDQLAIGIKC